MRARRTDANQDAIADEFERLGCIVDRTNKDWDLTVQFCGLTELVEVKNLETSYGRKGLSKRQQGMKLRRWTVYDARDVAQCVESLKTLKRALDAL